MAYDCDRRRELGGKLKTARQRTGLSAADAARMISAFDVRCTPGTVLAWERGSGGCAREPFASDLLVIAMVYRCSVDEFYPESPEFAVGPSPDTPSLETPWTMEPAHEPASPRQARQSTPADSGRSHRRKRIVNEAP